VQEPGDLSNLRGRGRRSLRFQAAVRDALTWSTARTLATSSFGVNGFRKNAIVVTDKISSRSA
jgi:hypothetical protein